MATKKTKEDSQNDPLRGQDSASEALGPADSSVVALQRTVGNQQMQRLLESGAVQAKLRVSQPGDAAEQEADHAADRAVATGSVIVEDDATTVGPGQMRKSEFVTLLQTTTCATADAVLESVGGTTKGCPYIKRWLGHYKDKDAHHLTRVMHKYAPESRRARSAHEAIEQVNRRVERAARSFAHTGKVSDLPEGIHEDMGGGGLGNALLTFLGGGNKGETPMLQRKSRDGASAGDYDAEHVQRQLGTGQALDARVASQMGSALGYDFSGVRVHSDTKAGELSGQLNAKAFTIGQDIAFASGEYQPGTLVGDALIAHELAHVAQQGGGASAGGMQSKDASLSDDSSLEQDADRSAVGAVISAWTGTKNGLAAISANALPRLKSGLKLQRCSCGSSIKRTSSTPELQRTQRTEVLASARKSGLADENAIVQAQADFMEAKNKAAAQALLPPGVAPTTAQTAAQQQGQVAQTSIPSSVSTLSPPEVADWTTRGNAAVSKVVTYAANHFPELGLTAADFNVDIVGVENRGARVVAYGEKVAGRKVATVGRTWVRYVEADPAYGMSVVVHELHGHPEYGPYGSPGVEYGLELYDKAAARMPGYTQPTGKARTKELDAFAYQETEIYSLLRSLPYHTALAPKDAALPNYVDPEPTVSWHIGEVKKQWEPRVARALLHGLYRRLASDSRLTSEAIEAFKRGIRAHYTGKESGFADEILE